MKRKSRNIKPIKKSKIKPVNFVMGILLIISFVCIGLAFNLLAPDTSQAMGPLNRTYITNTTELIQFRDRVNAGLNTTGVTVRLVNDIDMNGVTWNAGIGNTAANAFRGNFEGNGFTISNMQGAGLFAYINNAVVQNLNFIGGAFSTAPLVSRVLTSSTIANVHFVGNSTLGLVRNIAGLNSFIRDSSFAGTITSSDTITGGIVRNVTSDSHISIERVAFDGVLNANVGVSTASVISAGGLIGNLTRGSNAVINDSLVRGSISLSASATGTGGSIQAAGILGFTNNNSGGGQTALATSMTVRRTLVAATIYSRGTTTTNWRHVSSAGIGVMNGTNTARFDIFDTIIVSPSITTSLGARQRSATVAVIQRYNSSHTVPVVNITNLRRLDSIVVGASVGTIPTEFPVTLNNSQTAMHPMSWFQNAANITNTMGWDANIWSPANGNPDGLPVLNRNNNTASLGNDDGTWQATNIPITGWEGAGTAANPWRIRNARHFAGIAYVANKEDGVNNAARLAVRNGHFILMNDIDLSSRTWIPIQSFSGTLNGGGQTITLPSNIGNGLFNETDGTVTNLVLNSGDNIEFNKIETNAMSQQAGSLVGLLLGGARLSNIINKANIVATANGNATTAGQLIAIGGIVGRVNGSIIENVKNFGNISVSGSLGQNLTIGGIGGTEMGPVVIRNAANYGNISSNVTQVRVLTAGGIIASFHGFGSGSQIFNSYNRGNINISAFTQVNITGQHSSAGGIIGLTNKSVATTSTFDNVFSLGTLSVPASVFHGRIAGRFAIPHADARINLNRAYANSIATGAGLQVGEVNQPARLTRTANAVIAANNMVGANSLHQTMTNGRGTNAIWATWLASTNRTSYHPNATAVANVPMLDLTSLMSWQDDFIPDTEWFDRDVSADEFHISTNRELAGLARIVNSNQQNFDGRTVILGDDIDLRGRVWVPIGMGNNIFRGTFDGAMHEIFLPTIFDVCGGYSTPSVGTGTSHGTGLFGNAQTTTLKNLTLRGDVFVSRNQTNTIKFGSLLGGARQGGAVTIKNIVCFTNLTFNGSVGQGVTGGILGGLEHNATTMLNMANYGNRTFDSVLDLGGVVGKVQSNQLFTIINAYNRGQITARSRHLPNICAVGGVIGRLSAHPGTMPVNIQNLYGSRAVSINTGDGAGTVIGALWNAGLSGSVGTLIGPTGTQGVVGRGSSPLFSGIGTFDVSSGQMVTGGTGTVLSVLEDARSEFIENNSDFTSDDIFEWIASSDRTAMHANATAVLGVPMLTTPLTLTWQDAGIPLTAWANAAERGTAANPFLISNERELAGLAYLVNNGHHNFSGEHIRLTRSMDLRTRIWEPIGAAGSIRFNDNFFRGTFDGDLNTVSLPTILKTNGRTSAFFGATQNASINNLILDGTINNIIYLEDNAGTSADIGAVVGFAEGSLNLTNVVSRVNIEIDTIAGVGMWIGGIVANMRGTANLLNVANYGNIVYHSSVNTGAGGLVGILGSTATRISILNAYNRGDILISGVSGRGTSAAIGFVSANNIDILINNFFNTGSLGHPNVATQTIGGTAVNTRRMTRIRNFGNTGAFTASASGSGWVLNDRQDLGVFGMDGIINNMLVGNNANTHTVGQRLLVAMNVGRGEIASASAFVPSTWLVDGSPNTNIPMFRFLFDGDTDIRVSFAGGSSAGATARNITQNISGRDFRFEAYSDFLLEFNAGVGHLIGQVWLYTANGTRIDIRLDYDGEYFSFELGGYVTVELFDISTYVGMPRRIEINFRDIDIAAVMGAQIFANTQNDIFRIIFNPTDGYMPNGWEYPDNYYLVTFGIINRPGMPIPTTNKDGYIFSGWWTLPNGGARLINEFGSFVGTWTRTHTTTLYARWRPDTIAVTLVNGNQVSIDNTVRHGQYHLFDQATSTYGFDFLGWFTMPLVYIDGLFHLRHESGDSYILVLVDEQDFRITYDDGWTLFEWDRAIPATLFAVFNPPRPGFDRLVLHNFMYNDIVPQQLFFSNTGGDMLDRCADDFDYDGTVLLKYVPRGADLQFVINQFINDAAKIRAFTAGNIPINNLTREAADGMIIALMIDGERADQVVIVLASEDIHPNRLILTDNVYGTGRAQVLQFRGIGGEVLNRCDAGFDYDGVVFLAFLAVGERLEVLIRQFINYGGFIRVFRMDGSEVFGLGSEVVATGMMLALYIDGMRLDEVVLVVRGDLLGRGTVDVTDIAILQQHIFAEFDFELVGAFLLAADTLDRGTVDVTDIAILQQHIFAEFDFCMFDGLCLGV